MKGKKGLKDLVDRTGFSISTVSRVLNRKAVISDATREQILTAAREIGFDLSKYAPSTAADTIAFVAYYQPRTEYENPFFLHSIRGAYEGAREQGYGLQVYFRDDNDGDLVPSIAGQRSVSGIILSAVLESDIEALRAREFPFAVIGRPSKSDTAFWVDNDNYNASYTIVTDLLNAGKRNIAFVSRDLERHYARDRLNGYLQAFAIRGLQAPTELVFRCDTPGCEHLMERVKSGSVDAIIADDDETALTVANLVPPDGPRVRVIGFNYMPVPHIENVDLWLVDIKPRELGYWAARVLIQSIEERSAPINRLIPLAVAETTQPTT